MKSDELHKVWAACGNTSQNLTVKQIWDNTKKEREGGGSHIFVSPEKGGEGRLFNRLPLT